MAWDFEGGNLLSSPDDFLAWVLLQAWAAEEPSHGYPYQSYGSSQFQVFHVDFLHSLYYGQKGVLLAVENALILALSDSET